MSFLQYGNIFLRCQLLQNTETDIMSGVLIFPAGIPQSYNDIHTLLLFTFECQIFQFFQIDFTIKYPDCHLKSHGNFGKIKNSCQRRLLSVLLPLHGSAPQKNAMACCHGIWGILMSIPMLSRPIPRPAPTEPSRSFPELPSGSHLWQRN